jgi:hypothetical protein
MKLLITVIVSLWTCLLHAETFLLIHVEGKLQSGTLILQEGDSIQSNAPITFSSSDNLMIVASGKMLYSIKPSEALQVDRLDQLNLIPLQTSIPATRETESTITSLSDYFGNGKFILIRERFKLKLSNQDTSSQHFYVFRYQYKGKIISKKISENPTDLNFEKKLLYTNKKGKEIPCDSTSNSEILRYNIEKRAFTKVVAFEPKWIKEEIKSELDILKKTFKSNGISDSETETEMIKFVKSVYGKTDELLLKQVIKNLL